MSDIVKPEIGFLPTPTIMWPLPYAKHKSYSRCVNGVWCHYTGAHHVPYTQNDRDWLEVVTTYAVRTGNTLIELGRVTDELDNIGKRNENKNIQSARKSLERVYGLQVSIERTTEEKTHTRFEGLQFSVGEEIHLIWGKGRTPNESPVLSGMNYIQLSQRFVEFVTKSRGAVPHNREHYLSLSGPKKKDYYSWLILKLHGLQHTQVIRRDQILEQFFGQLPTKQLRANAWISFKKDLWYIKSNFYPEANIEADTDSIILKRSPALIEPGDRRAGYIL